MALETSATTIRPVAGNQIVRVQHEGLVTADAEKCKEFYVRVLGLEVLPRPPLTSRGYWLGAPGVYPQIHIIQSTDDTPPGPDHPISPRSRHTCFEVADFEALKATLEREGIAYRVIDQPGGNRQLLCNDPDGNTLEFQRCTL